MSSLRHSFGLVAIATGLSLLAAGCDTKVSQCNNLIKVANAATQEMQSLSQSKGPNRIEQMNQMADSLDKYAKEVQGLDIQDEKLKGFQQRLGDLYSGTRDASRELVAAANKKDVEAAKRSLQKMMTASQSEGTLVKDINDYCQAK